jgi:membrane protein
MTDGVRILASVDMWQRGHMAAAFPIAVLKKFSDDRGSSVAALMAYYAFLSVLPLLLVFVSVLGFVLEGDPSLQADIVDLLPGVSLAAVGALILQAAGDGTSIAR